MKRTLALFIMTLAATVFGQSSGTTSSRHYPLAHIHQGLPHNNRMLIIPTCQNCIITKYINGFYEHGHNGGPGPYYNHPRCLFLFNPAWPWQQGPRVNGNQSRQQPLNQQ